MSDETDRLTRVEVHVEYMRDELRELNGKVDTLISRPSSLELVGSLVAKHWKVLLVVTLTLTGAGWAAPILAALK